MATEYASLEPFPLFVDSAPPSSANYFSNIHTSLQLISAARPTSRDPMSSKPRVSLPEKWVRNVSLWYYQYEVTFGLYMLNYREKIVMNTIVTVLFSAIIYLMVWGLEQFLIRTLCQWIFCLTGSLDGVEEYCVR